MAKTIKNKTTIAAIIFIFACAAFALNAEAKVINERIYIVPAGDVDKKLLESLKEALPGYMPTTVRLEIAPREPLPETAYDASRKQYNADSILKYIQKKVLLDIRIEVALVLVDVDLYSPGSDFVYGISDAPKAMSVMSLYRLRNEFYGNKPDNKLFLKRATRQALYEIGNAWGLLQCPDQKCVMNTSGGSLDPDKKKIVFCHECKSKIRARSFGPIVQATLPVLK